MVSFTMEQQFSITDLAKDYDITSRTIRHYEDTGLLIPARNGTKRIFTSRDHVRLGLILRGRRIGFSLAEIREIINMYDLPEGEKRQTSFLLEKITERRQKLLEQQIDIQKMLSELEDIENRLTK